MYPLKGDQEKNRHELMAELEEYRQQLKQKQTHISDLEYQLRECKRNHSFVLNTNTIGYCILDRTGTIIEANDELARLTGYSDNRRIINRDILHFISSEDEEVFVSHLNICHEIGEIHNIEFHFQWPNGDTLSVEMNGSLYAEHHNQSIILFCRDISERKAIERAARESELHFKQLAENIEDVFWLTDWPMNKLIYLCPIFEKIWGVSTDEVLNDISRWWSAVHPDDHQRVIESFMNEVAAGTYDIEYRICRLDGGIRWIHDRGFPITNERGEVIRIAGIAKDITAQKQHVEELQSAYEQLAASEQQLRAANQQLTASEQQLLSANQQLKAGEQQLQAANRQLRESERKMATLLSNLPGMAYRCLNDRDWTMEFVSNGVQELTGYEADELIENRLLSFNQLLSAGDRQRIWDLTQEALREKRSFKFEYQITTKTGETKWVWEKGRGIYNSNGELIALEGFITDISDRKEYEKTLQDKERELLLIADNVPALISYVDNEYYYRFVNQGYEKAFNRTREDMVDKPVAQILPVEEFAEALPYVEKALRGEDVRYEMIRTINQQKRWMDIRYVPDTSQNGQVDGFYVLINDITDIKQASDAIKRSEERFRSLVETSSDLIWEISLDDTFTYLSPKVRDLIGYEPQELIGKKVLDYMPEDEARRVAKIVNKLKTELAPFTQEEKRFLHRDGHEVILQTSGVPVVDSQGNLRGYRGIDRDITEQKILEEERNRLTAIIEASTDFIGTASSDLRVLYINPGGRKMLGIGLEEDITETLLSDYYPQWVQEIIQNEGIPTAIREGSWIKETAFKTRDGREIPVSSSIIVHTNEQGDMLYLSTITRDISDIKEAEKALLESEGRYRSLVENSPISILVHCNDRIVYVNPKALDVLGASSEQDLLGKDALSIVHPESREIARQRMAILYNKEIPEDLVEQKFIRLDGKIIVAEIKSTPIDYQGKPASQVAFIDITERKKIEKALQEREATLQTLLQAAPIGIGFVSYPERTLGWTNLKLSEMTKMSNEELDHIPAEKLYPSREEFERVGKLKHPLVKKTGVGSVETQFKQKNGNVLDILLSSAAIDKNNIESGLVFTALDITEKKKAEAKIVLYQQQLKSLAVEMSRTEEKERRQIAADLHDNIGQMLVLSKMNVQMIQQTNPRPNAEQLKLLNQMVEQLDDAIHYVHSLLYRLSTPILYELGLEAALEWQLEQFYQRYNLKYKYSCDESPKPLTDEVRSVLFQGGKELMTNVIKHAQASLIDVVIKRMEDEIHIIVKDDGIGFQSNKTERSTSGFGLFNISERLDNLGGRLEIASHPEQGTEITLIAPLQK